jgi:hypothetical protein
MNDIELKISCPFCSERTDLLINKFAYARWQKGMLVQDAFPKRSATDRETLISGLCEKCQDEYLTPPNELP